MGKPTHHALNYFQQRVVSRHKDDAEDVKLTITELREIVAGINKGMAVLAQIGKYPDQKMVENKEGFEAVLKQYEELERAILNK